MFFLIDVLPNRIDAGRLSPGRLSLYAAAWPRGADWMAAAVWRADGGGAARIEWRAALSCAWPERRELGRWEGRGA